MGLLLAQVKVPVGATYFPKEIGLTPRALVFPFRACFCLFNLRTFCRFLRAKSNVMFESEHDNGGQLCGHQNAEIAVLAVGDDLGVMGDATGAIAPAQ